MDSDRWKSVEACYHSVLQRPVGHRAAFLDQACADDPELRREVESLLAHEGAADSLLENPAFRHLPPSDVTTTLAPGAVIAQYRVTSKLGAGGMGEVFRATDTKLHRDVALKLLAPAFAHDSRWLSRFQREARVLASLNHPHIAAIYGLETSGATSAIAMELVEGPTLAERLLRSPIPLRDAIAIASQIAEALEFAHEKGVIHRDLKPANVKLRPDGVVKVLDFGLAKELDSNDAPTATAPGAVLGTPAYMAPEQAAGLPVDRRADIWAFGVVLFEMLSGRQIYARKTPLETLAAVARDEPQWDSLPSDIPATILHLLRRCLDRDAKNRLRDIGEARVILQAPSSAAPRTSRRSVTLPWTAVALFLVAGLGGGYFWPRRPVREAPAAEFYVYAPEGASYDKIDSSRSISPDGRTLVFSARDSQSGLRALWVRPLDSVNARPIPGTQDGDFPFWSPDSQSLAFFADGKLLRVAIAGGTPVTLCEATIAGPGGGTWNRDGVILFASQRGLYHVPASGGLATRLTRPDAARYETAHGFPQFLPDGRRFLYYVQSSNLATQGLYAALLDHPLEGKRILATDHKAVYSPPLGNQPGFLLWLREQTLLAQAFDPGNLKLEGEPVPVAENIDQMSNASYVLSPAFAAFWPSDAGVLLYASDSLPHRKLLWLDRNGKLLREAGPEGAFKRYPHLSHDGGKAILRATASDRKDDLWLLDLGRDVMTRLTGDGRETGFSAWSPDGRSVAYASERNGVVQTYRKDVSGAGQEIQVTDGPEPNTVTSWSPDGRYLLCTRGRGAASEIWALPAGEGTQTPFLVVRVEGYAGSAVVSPDGKWLAYHSAESGRIEIYVRPFQSAANGNTGRWQVSNQGGMQPRWRGDGRELFYMAKGSILSAAAVRVDSGSFHSDAPRELFPVGVHEDDLWDPSADGQRFLVLGSDTVTAAAFSPLTVVLNWRARLK